MRVHLSGSSDRNTSPQGGEPSLVLNLRSGCVASCRVCQHKKYSQTESEAAKDLYLQRLLAPWADALQRTIGASSERRWHYRERVCLHASQQEAAWCFGIWQDDEVLAIPDCPVHTDKVNRVLAALRLFLPLTLPLRFVLVNEAFVTLVLKSKTMPLDALWVEKVYQAIVNEGFQGLWVNWSPSAGRRVLNSKAWQLLRGTRQAIDREGILLGPGDFSQLLPELAGQALARADDFFRKQQSTWIVDLYSGRGRSLQVWQRAGWNMRGVELAGDAVTTANTIFGRDTVLRGRASERLPQLQEWIEKQSQVGRVYANPPRLGLEPAISQWLNREAAFAGLAYLSCSPATLARDLALLTDWQVESLQPYDFFPQTRHVEVLATLRRKPRAVYSERVESYYRS